MISWSFEVELKWRRTISGRPLESELPLFRLWWEAIGPESRKRYLLRWHYSFE